MHTSEDEIYLASTPLFVQRVRFGLLAAIGKLLAYRTRYLAYSGTEEPLAAREGERPSSAGSGAKSKGIVVGTIVALMALILSVRQPTIPPRTGGLHPLR